MVEKARWNRKEGIAMSDQKKLLKVKWMWCAYTKSNLLQIVEKNQPNNAKKGTQKFAHNNLLQAQKSLFFVKPLILLDGWTSRTKCWMLYCLPIHHFSVQCSAHPFALTTFFSSGFVQLYLCYSHVWIRSDDYYCCLKSVFFSFS